MIISNYQSSRYRQVKSLIQQQQQTNKIFPRQIGFSDVALYTSVYASRAARCSNPHSIVPVENRWRRNVAIDSGHKATVGRPWPVDKVVT
jgi:hypothetical protein